MSTKVGRIAKHKHCHGRPASISSAVIDNDSHEGAVDEAEMARSQGRRSISYEFLWHRLGISR